MFNSVGFRVLSYPIHLFLLLVAFIQALTKKAPAYAQNLTKNVEPLNTKKARVGSTNPGQGQLKEQNPYDYDGLQAPEESWVQNGDPARLAIQAGRGLQIAQIS